MPLIVNSLLVLILLALASPARGMDFGDLRANSPTCKAQPRTKQPKPHQEPPQLRSLADSLRANYLRQIRNSLRIHLEHSVLFGYTPDHFAKEMAKAQRRCHFGGKFLEIITEEFKQSSAYVSESFVKGEGNGPIRGMRKSLEKRLMIALLEIGRIEKVLGRLSKNAQFATANPKLGNELIARREVIFRHYPQLRGINKRGAAATKMISILETRVFGMRVGDLLIASASTHPDIDQILFSRWGNRAVKNPSIGRLAGYTHKDKYTQRAYSRLYEEAYNRILDEGHARHYSDHWASTSFESFTVNSTRQVIQAMGTICGGGACEIAELNGSLLGVTLQRLSAQNKSEAEEAASQVCSCQLRKEKNRVPWWVALGVGIPVAGLGIGCGIATIASWGIVGPLCGFALGSILVTAPMSYWHMKDSQENRRTYSRLAKMNSTGIVSHAERVSSLRNLERLQTQTLWSEVFMGAEVVGSVAAIPRGLSWLMGLEKVAKPVAKMTRVVYHPSRVFGQAISKNLNMLKNNDISGYLKMIWKNHDNVGNRGVLFGFNPRLYSMQQRMQAWNGFKRVASYWVIGKRAAKEELFKAINTMRNFEKGAALEGEAKAAVAKLFTYINKYRDYELRIKKIVHRGFEAKMQVEDLNPLMKGANKLKPGHFAPRMVDGKKFKGRLITFRVVDDQGNAQEIVHHFDDWAAFKDFYKQAKNDYKHAFAHGSMDEFTNNSDLMQEFYHQAELREIVEYIQESTSDILSLKPGSAHQVHQSLHDFAQKALANLDLLPRSDAYYRFQYKLMFAEVRALFRQKILRQKLNPRTDLRSSTKYGGIFSDFDGIDAIKGFSNQLRSLLAIGAITGAGGGAWVLSEDPDVRFMWTKLVNKKNALIRVLRGYTAEELACAIEMREWTFLDGSCAVKLARDYLIEYYIRTKEDPHFDYRESSEYYVELHDYMMHIMDLSREWAVFGRDTYSQIKAEYKEIGYRETADSQVVMMIEQYFHDEGLAEMVEEILIAHRIGNNELAQYYLDDIARTYSFGGTLAADIRHYLDNVDAVKKKIGSHATLAMGKNKLPRFLTELWEDIAPPKEP